MRPLLSIHAENFRSLRRATVELRDLSVLVGPNESGKSNFLDIIQLLGDSVRTDLGPALEARGGYERVRFRGKRTTNSVTIEVKAKVTRYSSLTAPDEYRLTFWLGRLRRPNADDDQEGVRYLARREQFKFKRTKGRGRRITISGRRAEVLDVSAGKEKRREVGLRSDSLGLATLPRLSDDEGGNEITRMATLFSSFRVFNVNVHAARRPHQSDDNDELASDASNLAAFLYGLSRDDELFDDFQEDVRDLIPGVQKLIFRPVGGSTSAVAVQLVEDGLRNPTDLAEASFGTIRLLALLALLYDPNPPLLTCVEEIDHGLHPYVFDRLVERLREASRRTQLLVVTHSPALVNRLAPEELIVCERDSDGASIIPAVDASVIRIKEEATGGALRLGEIWFSGSLGGVPR